LWGELEPEEEEEEEEEDDEEEDEEEEAEPAPTDGMQTPSGLETPSGLTSVVSTVAGGLETPDFLELRKERISEVSEPTGPRSLYQVVPEKQTSVRGLMGSERGYDMSAVAGPAIPVLGDDRGSKVRSQVFLVGRVLIFYFITSASPVLMSLWMLLSWKESLRLNCAASMMPTREVMLGCQVVVGRTSRTWWPRKWPRKSKRWRENETARSRGKNLNSR
jgi:hypothetical protein